MSSSLLGSQFTSLNPGTVSLSLFKLSFCTTANLRSNLLWTHLPNRDDLFAVFDSVFRKDLQGSVTEKKVLKLIRGGDLLVCSLCLDLKALLMLSTHHTILLYKAGYRKPDAIVLLGKHRVGKLSPPSTT